MSAPTRTTGELADARVEAEGDSLGEAKWAAMKELEQRFPGIEVEHVEFEVLEERPGDGDEGFVRVAATRGRERLARGGEGVRVAGRAGRAGARDRAADDLATWVSGRASTSRRPTRRCARTSADPSSGC